TKGSKGEVVFLCHGGILRRLRLNSICTVFRRSRGTSALNLNALAVALNGHAIVSLCHEKNNVKMTCTAVAMPEVGCAPVPAVSPDQSGLCGAIPRPVQRCIAL